MKDYFQYTTQDGIQFKFDCHGSHVHLFHPEIKPHTFEDIYKVYIDYKISVMPNSPYRNTYNYFRSRKKNYKADPLIVAMPLYTEYCDENGGIYNITVVIDELLDILDSKLDENREEKELPAEAGQYFGDVIVGTYHHFGDGTRKYFYKVSKDIIVLSCMSGYAIEEKPVTVTLLRNDWEGLSKTVHDFINYMIKHGVEI